MFGFFKTHKPPRPPVSPPVPKWRPGIVQPIEQIIDRVSLHKLASLVASTHTLRQFTSSLEYSAKENAT
jgi:hypothetical protein